MTLSHASADANGAVRAESAAVAVPVCSATETIGVQPWFSWPLSRWQWWSRPVRAERLAALRIGLSAWLLFDLLTTYVPHLAAFYGKGSLGEPPLYNYLWSEKRWSWSILYGVQDQTYHYVAMIVWIIALAGLLTGCFTRVCAVIAWVLSMSFANLNADIDNAGDTVRGILLFYLAISPCGATWSLDAWRSKRTGAVFIYPWPLRLIFLQMGFIYWANGLHKAVGEDWQLGNSLYYVLGDATLTRVSRAEFGLPYWLTRIMSWTVLAWEVSLPLLLILRPVRLAGRFVAVLMWLSARFTSNNWFKRLLTFCVICWQGTLPFLLKLPPLPVVALCFGVMFHLGIWFSMELGMFAPYMLCMYLPLLPWEKLTDRYCLVYVSRAIPET